MEIIGIDHIGYAVNNLEESKKFFAILGFEFQADKEDKARNVNVSLGINTHGGGA